MSNVLIQNVLQHPNLVHAARLCGDILLFLPVLPGLHVLFPR